MCNYPLKFSADRNDTEQILCYPDETRNVHVKSTAENFLRTGAVPNKTIAHVKAIKKKEFVRVKSRKGVGFSGL